VGLLFIALSVPLIQGRVPPNAFYGFRTAKSLSDFKIWYEINRLSGIDLLIAGALISLGSVAMLFLGHGLQPQQVAFALLLADGIHAFRCRLARIYDADKNVEFSLKLVLNAVALWQDCGRKK
jgi:SdpI/YhfL family protein